MKEITEIFKIFSEKHLIPTLISTVVAIIFFAKVPDLFSIKEKTGSALYWLFIFCVTFLIVENILKIKRDIYIKINNRHIASSFKKDEEKDLNKLLEALWTYVDELSPQDKRYLWSFLKTDNEPIEIRGEWRGNTILANPQYVVSTKKAVNKDNQIIDASNGLTAYDIAMINSSYNITLYKLKDDFFKLLKYSYENYNKISHFDSEED